MVRYADGHEVNRGDKVVLSRPNGEVHSGEVTETEPVMSIQCGRRVFSLAIQEPETVLPAEIRKS